MRSAPETLLLWTGGALVILAFIFGVAAIFVPEFAKGGTTIVTVILGALGAPVTSLLAGQYFRRELGGAVEREQGKAADAGADANVGGP